MSWLVAPTCTARRRPAPRRRPAAPAPAAAPGCRRPRPSRRRSRGPAGRGPRRPRSPRRRPSSARGPARAAARASAASTSSRARNQASSETAAAAPPRAKVPSKSPRHARVPDHRSSSYREEHGLALALQVDVEPVAVVGRRRRSACARGLVGQRPQDDVLGVGLGLVGEVDAGDDAVEDAAREHRDVDVRRLQAALAVGHPAGLERADRVLAASTVCDAGEAAEAGVGRARRAGRRGGRSRRRGRPARSRPSRRGRRRRRRRTPGRGSRRRPAVPSAAAADAVGPGQPDGQVRADRRARAWARAGGARSRKPVPRCPERGWYGLGDLAGRPAGSRHHATSPSSSVSNGVWSVPRSTMSHSKASAQLSCGALEAIPADRRGPRRRRDGVEDRVLAEQRVVREVHLGDQPLGEGPAEQEKWMCAGRQALWWLPHG